MTTKYKIRECADGWTLDIPFPDEVVSLFFHSKNNAELAKAILECEDAHPNKAVPFQSTHIGDPLTLEQLRDMVGKPVWVETNRRKEWCILWGYHGPEIIGQAMIFTTRTAAKNQLPFAEYGETWLAYAYPPAHIDREAWEPCELCEDRQNPCTENNCYDKHGGNIDCSTTCKYRIKWDFIVRNIKFNKFCPNCGRPLTEEAWAMLEKKLNGGG